MPFYVKPDKIITRRCFRDISAKVESDVATCLENAALIFTPDLLTHRIILHDYIEQLEIQAVKVSGELDSTVGKPILFGPKDKIPANSAVIPIKVLSRELPLFYKWRFTVKKINSKGKPLCICSSPWQEQLKS
jgi:hypothetical protein